MPSMKKTNNIPAEINGVYLNILMHLSILCGLFLIHLINIFRIAWLNYIFVKYYFLIQMILQLE